MDRESLRLTGGKAGRLANRVAFFKRVEIERYKQQPWQHDFFQFEQFAGKRVLEIGVGLGTDLLQFARKRAA